MKVKRTQIKKAIYVIYMMFILNVTYSFFYTDYANTFAVLFALFGMLISTIPGLINGVLDKRIKQGFAAFLLPMILITMVSVFTARYVHGTPFNSSDVKQSLLRCFYYIIAFFVAYYSIRWFDKDAIRLIVISGWISYSTVFVKYLKNAGIKGIVNFDHGVGGVSLEVHNLTYCMGLFFIYYLVSCEYTKKEKLKMLIPILIAIVYGNKRTLFLGLAVSLLLYFLFNKFESRRMQMLRVVFGIYIIGAFIFLWLVRSGTFSAILAYFDIPDMSRLKMWNYFSSSYTISPNYWGRGIAYTDNMMAKSSTKQVLKLTVNIPIHNDILKAYIGWGFIPFLYYIVNFFLRQVHWFVKQSKENNGWRYFAIASCVYFINFFDNMITAINFNMCFFAIWLLLIKEKGNMDVGRRKKIYGQ